MSSLGEDNIELLVDRLEAVYGPPQHDHPSDPLDELVCCILSQHTTDATSFPTFDRLKELCPTWEQVIALGPERLSQVIRKAGLANQKSRSIIGCLVEIYSRNGEFHLENLRDLSLVDARKWLESLPGVGPKTASIVLCFSFGMNAIPVDTHVYRVCWRLGIIPEGIGEKRAHDRLLGLVPGGLAFRFHVALIQHGRQCCKAPLPMCEKCVVSDLCLWKLQNRAQRRVSS